MPLPTPRVDWRLNDRGVSSCDFNPQPSERFFQISVEITVGDRHHPGPKSPRLRRQQSDIAVGSQSLDAERLGLTRQQVNGVARQIPWIRELLRCDNGAAAVLELRS